MLMRGVTRLAARLSMVGIALYLAGCATYSQQAGSMRDSLLAGRPDLARAVAEKEDTGEDDVLACMNKGMLRRMTNDFETSNQILEIAKQRIDRLYGVSVTDVAGSLTINDATRDYYGDRYEQVLLHAFMAMNYLELGDYDAARVEMLQADVKMMEWGEQPDEDPFVRYLSGMIYESLDEPDQALVSYRKARDVYLATRNEQPVGVPVTLKRDILRLLAIEGLWDEYKQLKTDFGLANFKPQKLNDSYGELIVILNQGLAPVREEESIMTFAAEVENNVRVAFPAYKRDPVPVDNARVRVSGNRYQMELLEDIDSLARNALEAEMPLIMTRAVARAVIKYNTQQKAKEQGALAGFLMTVTNIATERADTRSWSTLPHQIKLSRVLLPIGQQEVDIDIVNAAGNVVDTIKAVVDIKPKQRSFLTRHWVAPVPVKAFTSTAQTQ